MPRKKNVAATSPAVQEKPPAQGLPATNASPPVSAAAAAESAHKWQGRSFRTTLTLGSKGVTIGVRDGHDWVVTFPGDPGKTIKDNLMAAGFEYRDKKWKAFSHAGNRPRVEAAVKEVKALVGDDVTIECHSVNQLPLVFSRVPPPFAGG